MTNRGRRRARAGARTPLLSPARRRAVALAACGALVGTMTTGCWAEPSAMPAVRDFLIAWQVGNYEAAAGRTVGADRRQVEDALGRVRQQLDAASLRLSLGTEVESTDVDQIVKKGDEADARFTVKIDLGENGQPWQYPGLMHLRRVGGKWKVVWDPSIINTKLKPGQRLAVVTQVPKRSPITDTAGRSALREIGAYQVGVFPGQLADPQKTIDQLTRQTKIDGGRRLDSERLLGRVRSAPPQTYLPLLTLQVPTHNALIQRLTHIPGLQFQGVRAPIAPAYAPELIGNLGPATADRLQQVGAPYQPGDTIGVSGIQLLQQRRLAGTPTVSVVAQDETGKSTEQLRSWPGQEPQQVQTTLDPAYQRHADDALAALRFPASMVAVRSSTGEVLAVANHGTGGQNLAFEGHYPPGLTFGIVSALALFSQAGMKQSTETTCPGTVTVGGKTFTNAARPGSTFANHFAASCKTTLAQLSGKVDGQTLVREAAQLGIGKNWGLGVPAFTGSVPVPANDGDKAAAMVGEGAVQVSPLAMAMVAAAAYSGTWRPPYVLKDPSTTAQAPQAQSPPSESISNLKRTLSRTASRGNARGARVSGDVGGVAALTTYNEGGRSKTVSWFVGYSGDRAFAIAVEGVVNTPALAAKFLGG
ncbi:cell division protein FtsI/penicillin-binding protein 2 [Actinomadura coerulea]|uniref:Cell division protein FtsI/penicillin-binding protein 2 n=1 Tax=Actinomadura coerulea TaxID=46159 RepID=A0A7X0G177_9ACTN|nr:penicillin-binding transpeptidase domain-containing protein [Actinomadura coerulea]MBB6397554.1 cell division protein FtsI/penicillin-binding protein 2 [Actinomadura coerulea]